MHACRWYAEYGVHWKVQHVACIIIRRMLFLKGYRTVIRGTDRPCNGARIDRTISTAVTVDAGHNRISPAITTSVAFSATLRGSM